MGGLISAFNPTCDVIASNSVSEARKEKIFLRTNFHDQFAKEESLFVSVRENFLERRKENMIATGENVSRSWVK